MKLPKDFSIRVMIYPNPDDPRTWLAHCLDMDLMGFGATVQSALEEVLQAVDGQIKYAQSPDEIFFRAPEELWAKLPACRKLPDELGVRALQNVFGNRVRYTTEAYAPTTSFRRADLKRELAKV